MTHATALAINADINMLQHHGVTVYPENIADSALPPCPDLAQDLGGRYLIKYIRQDSFNRLSAMSGITHFPGRHHVTPTVLCAADLGKALHLPPLPNPKYALLLNPAKVQAVGPRRILQGIGIEYILPNGFPVDAIIDPQWAVRIA
ncbi:hypothetical protein AB0346_07920 [Nocardia beijingensis]|uniref:hypothetical protein n=1 Tax=Nocardia beijingensis TaxID=95162 RepID=UPI00344B10E6